MSEILSTYKSKVHKATKHIGEIIKGPIGKIPEKTTRIALLTMEHTKMEEALEKAYNEAIKEFETPQR